MLWEKFLKKSINKIPNLSLDTDLVTVYKMDEDGPWRLKMALVLKGSGFNESLKSQKHCSLRIHMWSTSMQWLQYYLFLRLRPFIVCQLYRVRSKRNTDRDAKSDDKPCQVDYFYSSLCIHDSIHCRIEPISDLYHILWFLLRTCVF